MGLALDDRLVKALLPPVSGNRIVYDADVKGFGVRVTAAGAKAFVLTYRQGGVQRRLTIGSFPDWSVRAARERAKALKRDIDGGADPMKDRHEERAAPTVNDLADKFEAEHLSKRRAATQDSYSRVLRLYIRPKLGKSRVADVTFNEIERLHAEVAKSAPYQANRVLAVVSKMMSLAVTKWKMRGDNPAKGVERAPEERRERFLTAAEIARLSAALSELPERSSANAIRLLLLTGARKSETLNARWSEFDLELGTWTKPSAHTKQKRDHRVPLSAPARMLLAEMRTAADVDVARGGAAEFVFPGADGKPLGDIKKSWATVCRKAELGTGKGAAFKADARIHDLRHSYASILASHGLSLPVIGALLGHTQAATTHRYAHLIDDTLRAATERVGAVVSGATAAEVVEFRRGRG